MEARYFLRLPRSFRGCLRVSPTGIGARRHFASPSQPPSSTTSTPARTASATESTNTPTETPTQEVNSIQTPAPTSSNAQAQSTPPPSDGVRRHLANWKLEQEAKSRNANPLGSLGQEGRYPRSLGSAVPESTRPVGDFIQRELPRLQEYHLHVFATKHNCHMTLSEPSQPTEKGHIRRTIISLSCGNIGFRKAARGSYDAGFQLGTYMMSRIQNQGLLMKIQRLEVVFRGFGPGREAVQKILLGVEGNLLRDRVIRVVDATRLKFGGTRSRKPRRLG